jgi:hypothetical protein
MAGRRKSKIADLDWIPTALAKLTENKRRFVGLFFGELTVLVKILREALEAAPRGDMTPEDEQNANTSAQAVRERVSGRRAVSPLVNAPLTTQVGDTCYMCDDADISHEHSRPCAFFLKQRICRSALSGVNHGRAVDTERKHIRSAVQFDEESTQRTMQL